jgi:hypothetical protein
MVLGFWHFDVLLIDVSLKCWHLLMKVHSAKTNKNYIIYN